MQTMLTIRARRPALLATLLLAAAPGALLAQDAEGTPFMAELSGEAEVPPVETAAMGMADVRVDETAMTVTWTLAYEGLSGEPTAAHIHGPATPEETAPPVVDLTVDMEEATETTEEVAQDIMQGSAELTAEQLVDLQAGLYYFNIHTEQNPDGEIRGQVMEGEANMDAMEAMMGTMGGMDPATMTCADFMAMNQSGQMAAMDAMAANAMAAGDTMASDDMAAAEGTASDDTMASDDMAADAMGSDDMATDDTMASGDAMASDDAMAADEMAAGHDMAADTMATDDMAADDAMASDDAMAAGDMAVSPEMTTMMAACEGAPEMMAMEAMGAMETTEN
jgi:hypothetical protein